MKQTTCWTSDSGKTLRKLSTVCLDRDIPYSSLQLFQKRLIFFPAIFFNLEKLLFSALHIPCSYWGACYSCMVSYCLRTLNIGLSGLSYLNACGTNVTNHRFVECPSLFWKENMNMLTLLAMVWKHHLRYNFEQYFLITSNVVDYQNEGW